MDRKKDRRYGTYLDVVFEKIGKSGFTVYLKLVYKYKIKRIITAIRKDDQAALCQLAISKHGLILDELRRKAWPKMIGIDSSNASPKPDLKTIQNHYYHNQVVMDVNRSIRRFPPSIKEQQRMALQDQLIHLIMRILMKNPELHYYQGYHDICITFLLVLGEDVAFNVVEKVSNNQLKEIMEKTMEKTNNLLQYLYVILGRMDKELLHHMERSEVGIMFCLSWVITWFGHVLENYSTVVRLFDFFLACKSLMPVYLSTAVSNLIFISHYYPCEYHDDSLWHYKHSLEDYLEYFDSIKKANEWDEERAACMLVPSLGVGSRLLDDVTDSVRAKYSSLRIALLAAGAPHRLARIVLTHKEAIMNTECDMAIMHAKLSSIHEDLPFEDLIDKASQLYLDYPPESLALELLKKVAEEKERRLKIRNKSRNTNKGLEKFSVNRIHCWLKDTHVSSFGRWTVIITTGVAVAATFYAFIYKYSNT
ncbi:TBC1 domain family member 20 [Nymphon striatum]|nr:TBC1 domain family member 20 [Nymphon striatum]